MGRATIRELSDAVLEELQRLGYADQTIGMYRALYKRLQRYADENGIEEHTVEVCERWLKESLGIDPSFVVRRKEDPHKRNNYLPIRVCQCLTEWQLHGCLALKKQGKLAALAVPQQFKAAYESYAGFCRDAG